MDGRRRACMACGTCAAAAAFSAMVVAASAAPDGREARGIPVEIVEAEPGAPVLHREGPVAVELTYNKDGTIGAKMWEEDDPRFSTSSGSYPGEAFAYGCREGGGGTILDVYQYRGAAVIDGIAHVELARMEIPALEGMGCAFPDWGHSHNTTDFLDPLHTIYGGDDLAGHFEPDHPYVNRTEARETHMRTTYADPVRDATVFSGPDTHTYPARPYEWEPWRPGRELGGHPGWIADVWHDRSDDNVLGDAGIEWEALGLYDRALQSDPSHARTFIDKTGLADRMGSTGWPWHRTVGR
ncbi:MAG: hypothetical protein MPI95_02120 [Nitrosopumilus sp.]|nr:hypothetical protein [Nitrosopumilus sp.]CAI9831111.1 exported hypothetical protein [Nitrosopumilaceae archaeon]MDA7941198.1 hypothetical protein [Nitrosopumilus sp.]MDA7942404.1 hypothetical protein [Nitrosopumilus sp.]MDA7944875.1 hypothetical protein [Nitrosopumilus sp.]